MANFYRISKKVGETILLNLDKVDYISSYAKGLKVVYTLHYIKGNAEKTFDLEPTQELRQALGITD